MQKQRIEYFSPLDALVALAKRLNRYEDRYRMTSEEFYHHFCQGKMEDSNDVVEWSNDYQHYLALKLDIERQLKRAA